VSVVLVSADPQTRSHLAGLFEQQNFIFSAASSEEEGVEMAAAVRPSVLLIDLGSCGFEFIKRLKTNASTTGIPIFALTDQTLTVDERMDLTGQIERIFSRDSFSANDLITHLKDLEMLHPRRAGLLDDLTGLFNHRYLQLRLAQEVSRSLRYRIPLALILMDIDHFGHYVAAKGEYHGNLVLRKITELLKRNIRASDVVVRFAGDAFGVILPNTPVQPSLTLGRRFHSIIRDYPFLHEEVQPKGRITVSLGIATLKNHSPEGLVASAEAALARAIQRGGDCVEFQDHNG
jgi:diguanylate cyclase (GGDEF)-like protein